MLIFSTTYKIKMRWERNILDQSVPIFKFSELSYCLPNWFCFFMLKPVSLFLQSDQQPQRYCSLFLIMDAVSCQIFLLSLASSVQFSHSVVSDSLQPHELQHARRPCPSSTPGVHWDSRPSSQWAVQPPHPLLTPSPPAPNPYQHQSLFQWVNSSHEVAKVLEFQL